MPNAEMRPQYSVSRDRVDFGGLFGSGTVTNVNCPDGAAEFVNRGGHIPAPVQSLTN
jgi:hypothetical protein